MDEKEKSIFIQFSLAGDDAANTAKYGLIFAATRNMYVERVSGAHNSAASGGSLQLERLQSTEALDAGDTLLSTAYDPTATANTPQHLPLTASPVRSLKRGDRLAIKDTGSLAGLSGLNLTIELKISESVGKA